MALKPKGKTLLWGARSSLVGALALGGAVADQAVKLWMIHGFDLASQGRVELLPFLDLVMVWNYGISYGLFQQGSATGQLLLAAFTVAATALLWVWGTRVSDKVAAVSLGLIIAGAIGNGIDRIAYGAVADLFHFHVGAFSWYVFNLADVWIVAGVAGLLYDSFAGGPKDAAMSPQGKRGRMGEAIPSSSTRAESDEDASKAAGTASRQGHDDDENR
ncbi:signal peptidase II [Rhizobiales bacterium]|uniref:signal peptidase II n=1 Tax=Hongsoonwoonella zoysiae TaxID=2821844 RepID=UPI0015602C49|nr:signal peptidase II [Hongsoonwoonella zoysiae]